MWLYKQKRYEIKQLLKSAEAACWQKLFKEATKPNEFWRLTNLALRKHKTKNTLALISDHNEEIITLDLLYYCFVKSNDTVLTWQICMLPTVEVHENLHFESWTNNTKKKYFELGLLGTKRQILKELHLFGILTVSQKVTSCHIIKNSCNCKGKKLYNLSRVDYVFLASLFHKEI